VHPAGDPRRWWILAAVGVGTFLNVLDNSMLNVSLPTITRELGTDVATVQWVATAYLLVISSLLLTGGRLADVYGRRRVYLTGTVLFIVASTLAGLVTGVGQLIGLRVVQGIGSALVQGVGPAIVATAFPPNERGKVLGINSTTVALAGSSGPIVGGIVADLLGWRWIFFSRVPVSALVLVATVLLLPADPPPDRERRFDVAGAATLFLALAALLLGLSQGRIWGWGSAPVIGLFASAAALAVAFVWIELRAPEPMLPLDVFRNRLFATANASSFVIFTAISHSFFLMPFFLIGGQGLSASRAGLLLMPSSLMMSIAAPIAGTLSDRFGSRVLSPLGAAIAAGGLFALGQLTPESTALDVVWRSALVGLGIGTFGSPNNNAIMGAVPRERIGLAAGTMASMRNLGNVVGVALAGTVLTNRAELHELELAAAGLVAPLLQSRALVAGIQDAFLVASCVALAGAALASARGASPARAAARVAPAPPVFLKER
jgi:EmrB/QacA subfamily drug resistance transporter